MKTFTESQIREWAKRHDLMRSIQELREMFEDAASTKPEGKRRSLRPYRHPNP